MLDTFRSSIQYLISFACLVTCPSGAQAEDSSIPLPDDLKWESECVPEGLGVDPITFALYQLDWDNKSVEIHQAFLEKEVAFGEGGDNFEWEYLGSVHGNHRAVLSYNYYSSGWMHTSIKVLHREGNRFILTDSMGGGGILENVIYGVEVKNDQILYTRFLSDGYFVDEVVDMFPELQPWYDRSSKRGLCYRRSCYIGWCDYAANISSKGEIVNTDILRFHPAQGSESPLLAQPSGLVSIALGVLQEIDNDKPEEFKDNGIAFSPHVFKELLKADLADDDRRPKSVEIAKFKDEKYSGKDGFEWDYAGRIGDHHIVYFGFRDQDEGQYTGIYAVRKDGDALEKVARIARQVGYENEIKPNDCWVKELIVDGSELTYSHGCTAKNLFNAWLDACPELRAYAQSKDLSGLRDNGDKGTLTWKVEIAADGSVKSRSLESYKPCIWSGMEYERARRYCDEDLLLPIDVAVACVSALYAREYGNNDVIDMNEHLEHMLIDILERTFPAGPGH